MKTPPLEVVRSWPPPNRVNPESRGPANEIIAIILLTFVTALIVIRIYTRKWITKGFGLDDKLIVAAYIPATAFAISGIIADKKFGWGKHVWDNPSTVFTPGLQMALASHILFDLATSLTKLSMLALVYRIACASSKTLRIIVIALSTFISMSCTSFIVVTLLQCRPLDLYWTLSFTPQNCINESTHLLVAGIINTTTDFFVVLIPMVLVHRLHKHELSRRQMIVVIMLFGAGFLASLAGVARTYFTWLMTSAADFDTTWHAWMTWFMSAVELYVGIMCASLPATKPFFSRYVPRLLGSTYQPNVTEITKQTQKTTLSGRRSEDLHSLAMAEKDPSRPVTQGTDRSERSRRIMSSDLNKPLPVIKHSVYTIPIQLDYGDAPSYSRFSIDEAPTDKRSSSTDGPSKRPSEIFIPQGRWKRVDNDHDIV